MSSWSACFHACGVPTGFGQHNGGVSVQNTLDISLRFGIIAHDVCLGHESFKVQVFQFDKGTDLLDVNSPILQ